MEIVLSECRTLVISGGEGGGKSFLISIIATVDALIFFEDFGVDTPLLVWSVAADFEDARKELSYIGGFDSSPFSWLGQLEIFDAAHSSIPIHKDNRVILHTLTEEGWDITYESVSGYDPTKVGRDEPDIQLLCEASRCGQELYERCRGRMRRKKHARLLISGSPDGESWFTELFELGQGPNDQGVLSFPCPAWANPKNYPEGFEDPEIQAELSASSTPERFWERFGGQPQKASNLVLPEFKNLLHVSSSTEFDPNLPVHLAIDPGHRCYCVLFVQFVGDEIWVVDEIYMPGATHEAIIDMCTTKPAWVNVYSHERHVMDVAGAQQTGGRSKGTPYEAWAEDTDIWFERRRWTIEAGILRLRSVLGFNLKTNRPFLRINPRCKGLIAEGGGGRSPIKKGGKWKMVNGQPEGGTKAWDHAWKALYYLLLAIMGSARPAANAGSGGQVYSYLNSDDEEDWEGEGIWSTVEEEAPVAAPET